METRKERKATFEPVGRSVQIHHGPCSRLDCMPPLHTPPPPLSSHPRRAFMHEMRTTDKATNSTSMPIISSNHAVLPIHHPILLTHIPQEMYNHATMQPCNHVTMQLCTSTHAPLFFPLSLSLSRLCMIPSHLSTYLSAYTVGALSSVRNRNRVWLFAPCQHPRLAHDDHLHPPWPRSELPQDRPVRAHQQSDRAQGAQPRGQPP